MLIYHTNVADLASLSATSEGQVLTAEGVQHAHQSKVWRTGVVLSTELLVLDMGSAQTVNACIILNHDLIAGDTVTIQGNATDEWSSPSIAETIAHDTGVMAKTFTGGSYQFWRLKIDKQTAATSRDIGRLFLGPYATLPQPQGYSEIATDLSDTSRSVGGQTFSYVKPAYRTLRLRYAGLSEDDYQLLKNVNDDVGVHTPFFVQIGLIAPMDEHLYVKLSELTGRQYAYANCGGTYYWAAEISYEEQI